MNQKNRAVVRKMFKKTNNSFFIALIVIAGTGFFANRSAALEKEMLYFEETPVVFGAARHEQSLSEAL